MDNSRVESEVTRIERENAVSETKGRVIQQPKIEPVKEKIPASGSKSVNERGRNAEPPKDIRDIAPIKDRELIVE